MSLLWLFSGLLGLAGRSFGVCCKALACFVLPIVMPEGSLEAAHVQLGLISHASIVWPAAALRT